MSPSEAVSEGEEAFDYTISQTREKIRTGRQVSLVELNGASSSSLSALYRYESLTRNRGGECRAGVSAHLKKVLRASSSCVDSRNVFLCNFFYDAL